MPDVQPEEARYLVWLFDADGKVARARADVSPSELRRFVASTIEGEPIEGAGQVSFVLALGLMDDATDPQSVFASAMPEAVKWDDRALEVHRHTVPTIAPPEFAAPAGAEGSVIGVFRRPGRPRAGFTQPPFALSLWDTNPEGLEGLASEVGLRLDRFPAVNRPQQVDALFERLVDVHRLRRTIDLAAADDKQESESQTILAVQHGLDDVEQKVALWEAAFRDGEEFTARDHARLEEEMRRLVEWKGAFAEIEGVRVGLESRLTRLLDALAARDAAGNLQRVATALTSLVLVPTLVAGVYGANVAVPLAQSKAGWRVMLALMVSGAVLANIALSTIQFDQRDRGLTLRLPGRPRASEESDDRRWLVRVTLSLALGAALGLVAVASEALWRGVRLESGLETHAGTTQLTLCVVAVLMLLCMTYLLMREAQDRSPRHAALDAAVFVLGGFVTYCAVKDAWVELAGASVGTAVVVFLAAHSSTRRRVFDVYSGVT